MNVPAGELGRLRRGLLEALVNGQGRCTARLARHIRTCPHCRRRLRRIGRAELALSLLRTEARPRDLVSAANRQALEMLRASIRSAPKAAPLREVTARPPLGPRVLAAFEPLTRAAACLLVLCLARFGLFESMDTFQARGRKALRDYYVANVGEDLTEEALRSDETDGA